MPHSSTFHFQFRPAKFRSETFHVQAGETVVGRRVVTHEYPGRGIPLTEDLGRKAYEYTVEGFLVGADFNRCRHQSSTLEPEVNWIRTKSPPAIIDEKVFDRVQDLISDRAPLTGGGARSTPLFSGLLRCGGLRSADAYRKCNRAKCYIPLLPLQQRQAGHGVS